MPGTRRYRMDNCVPAGMRISICRALTGSSSNTFINMKRGRLVCKGTTNVKCGHVFVPVCALIMQLSNLLPSSYLDH